MHFEGDLRNTNTSGFAHTAIRVNQSLFLESSQDPEDSSHQLSNINPRI